MPTAGTLSTVAVTATLESQSVSAMPGTESSCEVCVRNVGMVVDRVLVDVLGHAKGWATIEPAELNLLPAESGTARVLFRPPRSSGVPAGEVPFAVRVVSTEDPEGSVVEEGVVQIGAFRELSAEIVPRTSHGKRVGKHRVAVENRGNSAVQVTVSAADPDDALEFRCAPDVLEAAPGTATFVTLRAAPKKRFLKGPNKTNPFQVFVLPGDDEPVTVDAVMLQRQTMPTWLLPALAVTGAAVIGLVALWFLLFKPEVESAATDAVAAQTRQLSSQAAKASEAAQRANDAADSATGASGGGGGGGSGAPGGPTRGPTESPGASPGRTATPTGSPAAIAPSTSAPGKPVSALISSDVAPGLVGSTSYRLPSGWRSLSVADIVVQNPAGDAGMLRIRSGDAVLFQFTLEDFRVLDYHFVQPLVFGAASPLTVVVDCKNAGARNCTAGLSYSGRLNK